MLIRNIKIFILELSKQEVFHLFQSCGVILFREFQVTYEQMKKFSAQFSDRYVIDPTKEHIGSVDGSLIQLADGGTHHIGPHCENASTPFVSDVIWFCCGVPIKGGETLFWNGVQVWNELSEPVKQLFQSKKVKYWRDVPVEQWKLFLGADSTIVDVKQLLSSIEGIKYHINDDESFYMEYTCSAVKKPNFDDQLAFANSVVYEYDRQRISLEDGLPIPDAVIAEIKDIMNRLTEVIPWQPGDLAMIDNSKFLHGRPAFEDADAKRKVFTTQTYF
jgi:hypothetical protein